MSVYYYLPIQPFPERYTEQWFTLFPGPIYRAGKVCITIEGSPITTEIKRGSFLDCNGSLGYQSFQLRQIARLFNDGMIQDGDVFFVADIEFWGIESIRYLATLNGKDVKMYGFCHAGSYTRGDFFEKCSPFAHHYETAWGAIFDKIFVGSLYHKQRLIEDRDIPAEKIFVTGNPYEIDETRNTFLKKGIKKKDRVILTNRPDPEKNVLKTLEVFRILKTRHPDWEFMATTGRKQWGTGEIREAAISMQDAGMLTIKEGISKNEYLTLLAESKVMTGNSLEENFGYTTLESLIVNTIPIQPRCCAHVELLQNNERCLFMNPIHQRQLIENAMWKPFDVSKYADRYKQSLPLIISHLTDENFKESLSQL